MVPAMFIFTVRHFMGYDKLWLQGNFGFKHLDHLKLDQRYKVMATTTPRDQKYKVYFQRSLVPQFQSFNSSFSTSNLVRTFHTCHN